MEAITKLLLRLLDFMYGKRIKVGEVSQERETRLMERKKND